MSRAVDRLFTTLVTFYDTCYLHIHRNWSALKIHGTTSTLSHVSMSQFFIKTYFRCCNWKYFPTSSQSGTVFLPSSTRAYLASEWQNKFLQWNVLFLWQDNIINSRNTTRWFLIFKCFNKYCDTNRKHQSRF